MSRKKKSRKPGWINLPKADKTTVEERTPRARKSTGNKAGTRQQVANKPRVVVENTQPKDPRIGSKKPIDLGIATKPVKKEKKQPKDSRPLVAPIKVADDTELFEQELLAIENNTELQLLAERQEDGEVLSAEEQAMLTASLERYQELISKLGLEDEEEIVQESDDEDELWSHLDKDDFSDFKE
ncbi:Der GTPase-activating protein YihI [Thalassomonas sp. M1454]|uniref:Der GTPase-activating protein YihI n=1 Tax=Thalassomonas sp. M1454 TaxID=2594477 RepID=UPI00117BE3B9|nr:Der GTPase-activating protein YihI [Thalassomonas sp. M1454]TRX54910.1 GTPase-activating protein [Thalassomonas sp. M1454]